MRYCYSNEILLQQLIVLYENKNCFGSLKIRVHVFDAFHLILNLYTCYGLVTADKSAFYTAN